MDPFRQAIELGYQPQPRRSQRLAQILFSLDPRRHVQVRLLQGNHGPIDRCSVHIKIIGQDLQEAPAPPAVEG